MKDKDMQLVMAALNCDIKLEDLVKPTRLNRLHPIKMQMFPSGSVSSGAECGVEIES